jgi:predicted nucleic acid-binding protein
VARPDSTVWIDYRKSRERTITDALDELLEERSVRLVGIVLSEVMRGARTPDEMRTVEELFERVPYIEMSRRVWERAGQLATTLDRAGTPVPFQDIVIGSIALEHNHELLTRDKHFERIPGLRLYKQEGEGEADA